MGFFNRHSKRIDPIPPPDDDSVTPDASWLAGDGDVAIPEGWHEPEPTAEPTPAPPQAETPEVETPEVEASEPVPVSENNPDPGPAAGERQLSSPNGNPAQGAEGDRSSGEAGHGRIRASSDHRSPAAPSEEGAGSDSDAGRITAADALTPVRRSFPEGSGDQAPARRAKIISFANQKGGVAKTTTTLNLAVAFAESGHSVLAVDLDPQGNLTMSQGIDPDKVERSMFDVLVHHIPIQEVIQHKEIDVAVASIDLAGAEIAMSTQIGRERSLEKALSAVVEDYDFICMDTPPSLGLLTVNALTASDKVIVPVQCEYLSMRGLVQLQNTLEMIRENLNPGVEIEGILPTMLDSRTVHAKEAVEILEENFGELVFKSRIRKAIKFAEAPVRGSSVLKYDPNGNAAECYRELAKEVLTNGAS